MIKTNTLSNARVVLNSRENPDSPPQLEIITTGPVTSEARLTAEEIVPESESGLNASSVYPNPVKDRIMVNVSNSISEYSAFAGASSGKDLSDMSAKAGIDNGAGYNRSWNRKFRKKCYAVAVSDFRNCRIY